MVNDILLAVLVIYLIISSALDRKYIRNSSCSQTEPIEVKHKKTKTKYKSAHEAATDIYNEE